MCEVGKVTKIKNGVATVRVDKKAECEKCGMCLFGKGATGVDFSCTNEAGAKEGDLVLIERSESGKFLGVLLVFLVRLVVEVQP